MSDPVAPRMPAAMQKGKRAVDVEKPESLWSLGFKRLRRHRMATVAFWVLGVLYLFAIFADFTAPYNYADSDRMGGFQPPTAIHLRTESGRFVAPFVYRYIPSADPTSSDFTIDTSRRYPIKFFVWGSEYRFFGLFKSNIHLFGVDAPARVLLFGNDQYGRDVFSRILFGGRVSLFVGFMGIIVSFSIGILLGGIAGYYGGVIDEVLMRLVEVIATIPGFYLLLALAAVLPSGLSSTTRFFMITFILAFIGWGGVARVIRGLVLSIRRVEFVQAAQACGASDMRVILRHVIPNTFSYLITAMTLTIPGYILQESGLSFLGLGIQEPQASWGNMLTAASTITNMVSYPWCLLPGLFIFIAVLSFNLLGDGVRDAFDPRSIM